MPNVEFVVQFMVPSSLAVWIQRAGRAARSVGDQGRVYLLVQPSVFQEKNKTKHIEEEDAEFVKEVESYLRKWIETEGCRRIIQDECFNNPPGRKRMSTCSRNIYVYI